VGFRSPGGEVPTLPFQGTEATVASVQKWLQQRMAEEYLPNYVYSYPSKRAYRPFNPPLSQRQIWEGVESASLNIYAHVPFCRYRCSFCTLFVTTMDSEILKQEYVDSLCRQTEMMGSIIECESVESIYIGGGTPTTLSPQQFEQLLGCMYEALPPLGPSAEVCVEGSPDTMTADLLGPLCDLGVTRISVGLQTLDDGELKGIGRPYTFETVERAIHNIRSIPFDSFNLDLIYGLSGQTMESWMRSLDTALAWEPTTLTLYPVVFRPLSVIEKQRHRHTFATDTDKYSMYDSAVYRLRSLGYRQESLVRFTKAQTHSGYVQEHSDFSGNPLLGLGTSSRSYAHNVHYATEFPVRLGAANRAISEFASARHDPEEEVALGIVLDDEELLRRYLILNLSLGRLSVRKALEYYGARYHMFVPHIEALTAEGLVCLTEDDAIELTEMGFKYSSLVGDLFRSSNVAKLEELFVAH